MAKQLCSVCGLPSFRGLKSGFGKCEWHWTAGNWGRKWALQTIGAEPLPPRVVPLQHIDDDGPEEIATCILSVLNVGKIKSDEELEELCDLTVRALEELIDYQDYPRR